MWFTLSFDVASDLFFKSYSFSAFFFILSSLNIFDYSILLISSIISFALFRIPCYDCWLYPMPSPVWNGEGVFVVVVAVVFVNIPVIPPVPNVYPPIPNKLGPVVTGAWPKRPPFLTLLLKGGAYRIGGCPPSWKLPPWGVAVYPNNPPPIVAVEGIVDMVVAPNNNPVFVGAAALNSPPVDDTA